MIRPASRPEVDAALHEARQFRNAGRIADAIRLLESLLARSGPEPRMLNMLGTIRLGSGDFGSAEKAFEQAVGLDASPPILLNLAMARNGMGDIAGEREALDLALSADPYFQLALLHRARWLKRHDQGATAAAAFNQFLATIAPGSELSPSLAAGVGEAEAVVQSEGALLANEIDNAFGEERPSAKVRAAIDIIAGRSRIYRSQPTSLYVPHLPETPWFDREQFPWFAQLERHTARITEELQMVLAEDAGVEPYIAFGTTDPLNQWRELNHSRAWSVLHLWRHGEPNLANQARCPLVTSLAASLPLLDLAGRGPNVMLSILAPGAHIPPHTGSSNARATIHLPLVIPPNCLFRVGAETREWQVGQAFGFDDTIEHEAWNNSDAPRAVLIVDAWNPFLSTADRADIVTLTRAMDRYAGRVDWGI